jgi:hypothetical protein
MTEEMTQTYTDLIEYNAEDFLKKFQELVLLGFRLTSVPMSFPIGIFQVQMEAYRRPNRRRSSEGIPDVGPYTEAHMKQMGLEELRRRTREEYGLTDKSLHGLMKKVLKYQGVQK